MSRSDLRKMLDEMFNPRGYTCAGESKGVLCTDTYDFLYTHSFKPDMLVSIAQVPIDVEKN